MVALLTCPLCRTDLERLAEAGGNEAGFTACPSCSADLAPYRELKNRALKYFTLAQDFISRGELDQAQSLVDSLPQVIGEGELPLHRLLAKFALAKGDLGQAAEYAKQCEPHEQSQLQEAIVLQSKNQSSAREQYNYALTAARAGQYQLATKWLSSAAALDPQNPDIWQLKLKVDLAARDYQATYLDLSELDRLASRPPEFYALEQLLPPLS